MRALLAGALQNRISAVGVALTTASAFVFLFLVSLEMGGLLRSPYAGLVVFVMLPAILVLGLLLIPIGLWSEGHARPRGDARAERRRLGLNASDVRGTLMFLAAATVVNLGLLSFASYGAVHYTESQQFCGQACHVMEPQFVAHQNGPHARVPCVACHVEPGAPGFVKAKMNGTRQLVMMMTGHYPRPIPPPVDNRVPNAHTSCEQCHWPDRYVGDVTRVLYEYADDEANTETKTTLRLHVGGPVAGTTTGTGIHWHMNRGNQVEYVAVDSTLAQIPYVRVSDLDGKVREYYAEGVVERDLTGRSRRQMSCIDCHNRPAHHFASTPERSVDAAIGAGLINARIPFIHRNAVGAVTTAYPTRAAAFAGIERTLRSTIHPASTAGAADIAQAIAVTQNIYRVNVFPEMKVGWGTYTNQIGHTTSDGCFRCHDDKHRTKDGLTIRQDCEICHAIE